MTSYAVRDGRPEPVADVAHFHKHGGGGYKSDIRDLALFVAAMAERGLIGAAASDVMWTAQETTDGADTCFGLGVLVEGKGAGLKVFHAGKQDEVRSWMSIFPNRGDGVVILCNTQGAELTRISAAVEGAVRSGS